MSEVRIGCHGLNGHQIHSHRPHLRNARIVALSGVTGGEFESLCKDNPHLAGGARRYCELAELLADEQVDMVSLCSARRSEQPAHAVRSLEAGKHVYAEKPLAVTLEDLDHIRDAVSRSGKHLRAMTPNCHRPAFTAMREAVQAGTIGRVVQVCAQKSYPYHDGRPQDRDVDGGLITQAGIHSVTAIRWVTGLEFESVAAFDTTAGNPREGDLQMAAGMIFTLSGGAVGVVNLNYLNPKKIGWWGDDRLRVHGTDGMIETLRGGQSACLTTHDSETKELKVDPRDDRAHLQAFIDLINDNTPMRVTFEENLVESRVVITAQRSADQGGKVIRI